LLIGIAAVFSALTLMVGGQEEHLPCSNLISNYPQRVSFKRYGGREMVAGLSRSVWNMSMRTAYVECVIVVSDRLTERTVEHG